jgi:hypothetical protein
MSGRAVGWVFDHSPMRGAAFLVQVALADVANDMHENELWCSTVTLSKKCRCARYTVTRALADLVDAGQLEVIAETPGRSTRYRMLFSTPATTDGTPSADLPPEVATGATTSDPTCHERWHKLNRTQANNPADADFSDWHEQDKDPEKLAALMADRFGKRADLA